MNSLNNRTFGVYGFGRAGRSLCTSLSQIENAKVIIYCRSPNRAQIDHAARCNAQLIDSEIEFLNQLAASQTELLFLAVTDGAIKLVSRRLSALDRLPEITVHLAGVFSCEELSEVKHQTSTAQFHPLVSLDGENGIPAGCLIAINCCEAKTVEKLSQLVALLNCEVGVLRSGDQHLYHAAATLTGNLSLGLISFSQDLLEQCGLDKRKSQIMLAHLLKSAACAVIRNDLTVALTGPIARADSDTIEKHVSALFDHKEILSVYEALSGKLLSVSKTPDDKKSEITAMLTQRPVK